jgi:hypothetical protein
MYIITHLYVVKDSWSFEILKQFKNILWSFKVLESHIFKFMSFFCVCLICSYHLYFFKEKSFIMSPYDNPLQNWLLLTQQVYIFKCLELNPKLKIESNEFLL